MARAVTMRVDRDDVTDAKIRLRTRLAVDRECGAGRIEAHAVEEHAAESRDRAAGYNRHVLRCCLRRVVAGRTAATACGEAHHCDCGDGGLRQKCPTHVVELPLRCVDN